MNAFQIAIVAGCLVGLGVALLVAALLPAHPDLKQSIERLDPGSDQKIEVVDVGVDGLKNKVGIWAQRRAPAEVMRRIPRQELYLLDRPVYQHFGEKVLLGIVGLIAGPFVTFMLTLLGISLPFVFPVGLSPLLGLVFFMLPDATVRQEAGKARKEFTRALASYVDLVALERASGSGSTQSLETAATVGDSWVFRRIAEVLNRARWSGQPPWDGLKELSDQIGLTDLGDVAEIMRLSREEGASVVGQLRARADSIRSALLNEDLAKANAAGEQMAVPVSALALVFLLILAAPAVMRIIG